MKKNKLFEKNEQIDLSEQMTLLINGYFEFPLQAIKLNGTFCDLMFDLYSVSTFKDLIVEINNEVNSLDGKRKEHSISIPAVWDINLIKTVVKFSKHHSCQDCNPGEHLPLTIEDIL